MRPIFIVILFIPFFSFSQEAFHNIKSTEGRELEVYELHLTGKKWRVFPEEIRSFKNLRSLKIKRAGLTSIPEWIGEMPIEKLSFAKNKLESFPPGILKVKDLLSLDLGHNFISVVPEEISQLTLLEDLNLWGNTIYDLPEELNELANLKKIDLRVIDINRHEQADLRLRFPEITIEMSPPCNCQ